MQHARPRRRDERAQRGFTIIELMIVVFIIAVLAGMVLTALSTNVKRARTAEAIGHLQKMWAGATAYFETDHTNSTGVLLDHQFPHAPAGPCVAVTEPLPCCQGPQGRCPGNPSEYLTLEPWKSLGFSMPDQHLYRAYFTACPADSDPRHGFVAEARGDLDCDGTASIFRRTANLVNNEIIGSTTAGKINETE